MNVTIFSNFSVVSTNVSINDAPIFTRRIFSVGETCVYGKLIYQRLTESDTFDIFDPNTKVIPKEGDQITSGSMNYMCKAYLGFPAPYDDTVHWQSVANLPYEYDTYYASGQVVNRNGRIYLCLQNHTSPSIDKAVVWKKFQASTYYPDGISSYNARYFRLKKPFSAYSTGSSTAPSQVLLGKLISSGNTYWEDITDSMIIPTDSAYWADITDHTHDPYTFYAEGSALIVNAIIYRCIVPITLPDPSVDSDRWEVSETSLPTNTNDWKSLGAVNAWRMFDQYYSTYTENQGSIEVAITECDFNAIWFGKLYADSIQITIIDNVSAETVEYAEIDLTIDCVDALDYFIGNWMYKRRPTATYERTSVYDDVSAIIKIFGDTVRCGVLFPGKSFYIGDDTWGSDIDAIRSDTVIEDTDTLELTVQKGIELKLNSIKLEIETARLKTVDEILDEASGQPSVFYAGNENLISYALIKGKKLSLQPSRSIINLETRSLL